MKPIFCSLLLICSLALSDHMIVRVYVSSGQDLKALSEKTIDIAAIKHGEWVDIVADEQLLNKIAGSGLPYEIRILSLEYEKEQVRGQYHSYAEVTQLLRNMANNYPAICKLDSLPLRTYQNRWIYGVKISDEPAIEDPGEPGFLVDGLHHSREWATIEIVLFFADSMLKGYGNVSQITNIINSTEIYCFPAINVDGYLYDYPGQNLWRKNREPFGGATGTDPNRNYSCCAGNPDGDWGAVDNDGFYSKATHFPDDDLFCGAWQNSGDETRGLTQFVKTHTVNAYLSYHMYGELFMWGWGWTTQGTPDAAIYQQKGNYMAGLIQRISGGTYTPGQIPNLLYPVSGGSIDWVYSYNHYVNGIANLSYGIEAGTDFYQPVTNLDQMVRQNFKALKYLADFTDSIIILLEGVVPPPAIYPGTDTVPPNFSLTWHPKNPEENHPVRWELAELSGLTVKTDSLETGSALWILDGYSLSTAQSHSPTHSFFSGNTSNMNNATQTKNPYLVRSGDSLTFWCRYNLENNYDVTVAEVSENTKEWFMVDTIVRLTGSQTTWTRKAYSLAGWLNKSVYFRFRTMSDGGTNNGGFYVDDIRPVPNYSSSATVSNNITDTTYSFTNHPEGTFYYYVHGNNTAWGWGDFSCLRKVVVSQNYTSEGDPATDGYARASLSMEPNPFTMNIKIRYNLIDRVQASLIVYDAAGRQVRDLTKQIRPNDTQGSSYIIWTGTDEMNRRLPAGVYFVRLKTGSVMLNRQIVLL